MLKLYLRKSLKGNAISFQQQLFTSIGEIFLQPMPKYQYQIEQGTELVYQFSTLFLLS